jgi:sec-independent protein translocase protein TatA
MIPSVGPMELVILLVIALIVFGPKRVPELGRSLGKGIRSFRGALDGEKEEQQRPRSRPDPELIEKGSDDHHE